MDGLNVASKIRTDVDKVIIKIICNLFSIIN